MKRDDEFRPVMGRSLVVDRDRFPTFTAQMARAIARRGGYRTAKRSAPQRGRIAVRAPHASSRRCVIKARYVPLTSRGLRAAKAHLAYLERDGVERDGSAGRLYGAGESFRPDEFHAPLKNEQRQFRFIVSPEDGDKLDLKEFARELMQRVEKDTGRRLIWAAVNHHNTDNPHVHIVIRGVDRDGGDLRIDGRYISRGMRWRAQEVATRELGPRLENDLSRPGSADINRLRLTEIDRVLDDHMSAERTVTLKSLLSAAGTDGRLCIGRLQTLEQMRLVHKDRGGTWHFQEDWKESLVQIGAREEMLQRLVPVVGVQAAGYQMLDPQRPCPVIEGVVKGKGLDDELTGRMFVAVAGPEGGCFYVRLAPEIAESVRPGDRVRAGIEIAPWVKPADAIIARSALENGGVYDPARHQRALENLAWRNSEPGQPTAAERVQANLRRLERLERYRLVTRLPDGKWRIPQDLVDQLRAREKTHPQHRIHFAKVPAVTREPTREAAPKPDAERMQLGQRLAATLNMTFDPNPPTFAGRLTQCPPSSSPSAAGHAYAQIVDERNRRFTLVPKPVDMERMLGRVVSLSRDREQHLVLRLGLGLSR